MTRPMIPADDTRIDDHLLASFIQIDEAIRSGASEPELDYLLGGSTLRGTPLNQSQIDELSDAILGIEALAANRLALSRDLPLPAGVSRHIGRFEIDGVLGSGGFAVVYRAHDRYLDRIAAVKIPRLHALVSPDLQQRFIREAQAVAKLDHPHIVTTYEAGEDAGIPYIAYAYCAGPTLAAWLRTRQEPLPVQLAAKIVISLANAVQFSHSHGILHRDLKPSNVLLFPQQTVSDPDFPFTAKLADFGLAKQTDIDLDETASGTMLGTPRYMAPEQFATSSQASIGPPADVYGLGGILYELLTGQAPFTATATWDIVTQVREYAPALPRLIRPQIPPDLETICMTCLAKAPAERYQTADDLATDLVRYLDGRQILARRVSLARQFWKWCSRHKMVASLGLTAAGAVTLLLLGLAAHAWQMEHLGRNLANNNQQLRDTVTQLDKALISGRKSKQLADQRAQELARTVYSIQIHQANEAWKRGDVRSMTELLQPFLTIPPGEDDLREFAWYYLWRQQAAQELFRTNLPSRQYAARFSPDGRSVAFAGEDSIVRIFSSPDFRLVREIPTTQKEVNSLLFDAQGDWLATAGDDGTVAKWDLKTGERLALWQFFNGKPAYQLAYSKTLDMGIVCGNHPDVRLFDLKTGQTKGVLAAADATSLEALALSPDGTQLLTCGTNATAVIWNLKTHRRERDLPGSLGYVSAGAWSPDGQHVAVTPKNNILMVWHAQSGELVYKVNFLDPGQSMAVNNDGLLLVADRGGSITTFLFPRITTAPRPSSPVARWTLHRDRIYGLDISPDGTRFATASRDRQVAVLQLQTTIPVVTREPVGTRTGSIFRDIVGPDHQGRFYQLSGDSIMVSNSTTSSESTALMRGKLFSTLALRDRILMAGDFDGQLYRWNVDAGFHQPEIFPVFSNKEVNQITPLDENRVYLRNERPEIALWDLAKRHAIIGAPIGDSVAISRDDRYLAISRTNPNELVLYDAATLTKLRSNHSHPEAIHALAFSASGRTLVTGSTDRMIRILDVDTMTVRHTMSGHASAVGVVAISPDERTLASSDDSGSVRLWDLRTGRELLTLYKHDNRFGTLEFSPTGHELRGIDRDRIEFRWLTQGPEFSLQTK